MADTLDDSLVVETMVEPMIVLEVKSVPVEPVSLLLESPADEDVSRETGFRVDELVSNCLVNVPDTEEADIVCCFEEPEVLVDVCVVPSAMDEVATDLRVEL